jgi:hypothetical protein
VCYLPRAIVYDRLVANLLDEQVERPRLRV